MKIWYRSLGALLFSFALVATASATSVGAPPALVGATDKATIYRLDANSTLVEGCFLPCACPLQLATSFRGTFGLRRVFTQDPLFDQTFVVSDVNWLANIGGVERRITGEGMFRFTTAAAGNLQEMVLQLSTDGADPVTFDSGLLPGGAGRLFPSIDIAIDMNDQVCLDTVIAVSASPVPKDEISRFKVGGSSNYFSGCFAPCQCIAVFIHDIVGSYDLVPLSTSGGFGEYALVHVSLELEDSFTNAFIGTATGAGILSVTPGSILAVEQRLRISLTLNDVRGNFDSGTVPGVLGPPVSLDISVNQNGLVCIDTVYSIESRILQ